MPKGKYPRKSYADRFWEKVDKNGPIPAHCPELGPCWVWTASLVQGYGQFWLNGKQQKAHRVAYELEHGLIPDEVMVLHRCDNRACCRDSHHFTGDHKDNMRDRNEKGRQLQGARHHFSKNTDEQIEEIRALWSTGDYSQQELGNMYGRSQVSVSTIVRGLFRKPKGR